MSLADDQDMTAPVQVDEDELRRQRNRRLEKIGTWTLPVLVMIVALYLWDRTVVWNEIPHYILPGPGLVFETLIKDWVMLFDALLVTLQITLMALAVAVLGGVGLAILFTQSRWVEMSFYPYAVILQVTPIVSIAPLIFIYVDNRLAGLLLCAWLVAFFSGVVEHNAWPELGGSWVARPLSDLRSDALATVALSAIAFGFALFPWRIADCGRAVPDWRGCCRVCRRYRGHRVRSGIQNFGGRVSAQHPHACLRRSF